MSEENRFDNGITNGESSEKGSKKSILPAMFDSFKKIPKKAQIGIIASAAAVVVGLVIVLIILIVQSNNIENNSILVFKKGNEFVVRINDKELALPDADAVSFKAETKNKRVYYTIPSAYDEKLFDLYYVELDGSEITAPAIIDFGIEKDFEVSDGKVYYLKFNSKSNANDGCVCEIKSKKITSFASNVDEIYIMGESGIYFTKMHGANKVLYSFFEETPLEVCRNIYQIYSFGNAEKPHLIYESRTGIATTSSQLYVVYEGESPEMLCDSATNVMYDNYEPGGNLYYFTTSQESVSWSYVISDDYAESDKSITKPNRLDYWDLFGVTEAYNKAYVAYQDKLIRDEIRAALDETVEKGGFTAPVYTAFAYNGESVCKIAQNVDPAKVYAFASFGDPKIVFENTTIKEKETDMATLSQIAARSGMDEVINYACSIVANSVDTKGMAVAVVQNGSGITYELTDYDKSRTQFSFSQDGENLFALVKDTQGERYSLFTSSLSQSKPSEKKTVAASITSFGIKNNSAVYLKTDVGKVTGDIFSFDGTESIKISNSAVDFVLNGAEDILVLKEYNGFYSEPLADCYAYSDGEEIKVGDSVVVSSFVTRKDGACAFVENSDGVTTLRIYNDGKSVEVAVDATEIILFN